MIWTHLDIFPIIVSTHDDLRARARQQDLQIQSLLAKFDQLHMDAKVNKWTQQGRDIAKLKDSNVGPSYAHTLARSCVLSYLPCCSASCRAGYVPLLCLSHRAPRCGPFTYVVIISTALELITYLTSKRA